MPDYSRCARGIRLAPSVGHIFFGPQREFLKAHLLTRLDQFLDFSRGYIRVSSDDDGRFAARLVVRFKEFRLGDQEGSQTGDGNEFPAVDDVAFARQLQKDGVI